MQLQTRQGFDPRWLDDALHLYREAGLGQKDADQLQAQRRNEAAPFLQKYRKSCRDQLQRVRQFIVVEPLHWPATDIHALRGDESPDALKLVPTVIRAFTDCTGSKRITREEA